MSRALWRRLIERLVAALPRGGSLPEIVWRKRQRAILLLLWAHVLIIPLFALLRGYDPLHSLIDGAIVAAFAVLASLKDRSRKYTCTASALGLLSSSAVLVDVSGGSLEVHFHFFVMIGVLSLYEDWLPFLIAVGFVLLHHGLVGTLYPTAVFNGSVEQARPFTWAAIHAFFVACAGLVYIAAWRLNEDVRLELVASSRQLAESEDRFRNAFENAPIGMALVGVTGSFLRVNRSLCQMLGRSEEELLALTFDDITPAEDIEESRAIWPQLLSGEMTNFQAERRYIHGEGHAVWALLSTSPIPDDEGHPLHFVAQIQNISKRKSAERETQRTMELLDHSNEQRRLLLDRTVRAGEEERTRIAAELHDGPIQHLAAIDIRLEGARRRLDRGEPEVSSKAVEKAQGHLRSEILGLRRMMYELRPPALDERGLDAALRDYIDNVARETGLECEFESQLDDRLAPALETILFRVAQEALTNVVKHARAHEVTLSVRATDANIELDVCDDGIGFDPKQARAMAGANHFGLIGMRERVASAGGSFDIHSKRGGGSRIHAVLPQEMSQR